MGCEALEDWVGEDWSPRQEAEGRELLQDTAGARQAVGVGSLKMTRALSTPKCERRTLCLLHSFQKADSAL